MSEALEQLQDGTSLQQVALAVQDSDAQRTLFVQSLYQSYLHRSASASEVAEWVQLMDHGATDTQIQVDFLTSSEFYSNKGGNSGWISALYTDVLGRPASSTEINAWLGVLANTGGLQSVARGILQSAEYDTDAINQGLQAVILQRTPSSAEIQEWLPQFLAGRTYDSFVAALEGLSEFAGVMSFALEQAALVEHITRRQ